MVKIVKHTLELVKFSHTLFAMPFALTAMFYAKKQIPPWPLFLKIFACLILARTAAMAFNRLVDAPFDAKNPRTVNRHLPAGILSKPYVIGLIIISSLLFIVTTYFINPLSFWLSPLALIIVLGYSLTKRFTHYTQLFLGLSLGIAPIAAWIAVTGKIETPPLLLGIAVLFWVSGFDIIYSTQDYEFDRQNSLKSLVVLMGPRRALLLSRLFHFIFWIILGLFAYFADLYWLGWIGSLLVGVILMAEHGLLKLDQPKKITAAFFTANGILSVVYFVLVSLDLFLHVPS